MKFIKTYESFSTLSEEQKTALNTALAEVKDSSAEKVNINSDVVNPKGIAKNPLYDRGQRELDGLGKAYGEFVPGSINKDKNIITAEVIHGVKYSTNKKTEFKSVITMDAKPLEYTIKKIETQL